MKYAALAGLVAGSVWGFGCLPDDGRPTPAVVVLNLALPSELRPEADESAPITFQTDDGWQIALEQLRVSVGRVALSGDDCNPYSEVPYLRILDLTEPGPQRVGQLWGLSACQLDYQVHAPDANSVLGERIADADREQMRRDRGWLASGADIDTAVGTALRVRGSASKEQAVVSFDWAFSAPHAWTKCRRSFDATVEADLPLTGGETLVVDLTLDPRSLFRGRKASPAEVGASISQLIFDADRQQGNSDGRVDLSELSQVQPPGGDESLAQMVLRTGYPAMFAYGGGTHCELDAPVDDVNLNF